MTARDLPLKLITFSGFLMLFFSCQRASSGDSKTYVDKTLIEQDVISEMREQDSIRQAHELAEAIQLRLLDADRNILDFRTELIRNISPSSSEQAYHSIDTARSVYDPYTKSFSTLFEIGWYANIHGVYDETKDLHLYTGKITMYGTGEKRFETISCNQNLIDGAKAIQAWNDIGSFIDSYNKNQ